MTFAQLLDLAPDIGGLAVLLAVGITVVNVFLGGTGGRKR